MQYVALMLVVVMVGLLAALSGDLAARLGDGSVGRKRQLRLALVGLSVLALLLVLAAGILSTMFPTTEKFAPGSQPLREGLSATAEIVTALFPFWAGLACNLAFPRTMASPKLRFMWGAWTVLALVPVGVMIDIFVGCNLAGACF